MLPTASCPHCRTTVLIYRDVGHSEDPQTAPLRSFCLDCHSPLDRWGEAAALTPVTLGDAEGLGYRDLNRAQPVGPGGCFMTRGCEGCPKIDTRPW